MQEASNLLQCIVNLLCQEASPSPSLLPILDPTCTKFDLDRGVAERKGPLIAIEVANLERGQEVDNIENYEKLHIPKHVTLDSSIYSCIGCIEASTNHYRVIMTISELDSGKFLPKGQTLKSGCYQIDNLFGETKKDAGMTTRVGTWISQTPQVEDNLAGRVLS